MRLARIRRGLSFSLLGAALGILPWSAAHAQTDVAASVYGAFSESTSGGGVVQSPSNAAGALVEVRHIRNPLIGFEGTYAFNRANQEYSVPVTCGLPCSTPPPTAVSANAHEITGDWVASVKISNLRPFALVGGGILLNEPSSGQSDTRSETKPVFVYGAGLDWGLLPHLGVRLQYRGNLYKAPNLSRLFTSTSAFTQTAEPVIGVYLRL
jgi:opacity protein-like surface antigen